MQRSWRREGHGSEREGDDLVKSLPEWKRAGLFCRTLSMKWGTVDAVGRERPAISIALVVTGAADNDLNTCHYGAFRAFRLPYRSVLTPEMAVGRD